MLSIGSPKFLILRYSAGWSLLIIFCALCRLYVVSLIFAGMFLCTMYVFFLILFVISSYCLRSIYVCSTELYLVATSKSGSTVSVQTQIGGRNAIWTTFLTPKTSKDFYPSRLTYNIYEIFHISCILENVLVTQKVLYPSTLRYILCNANWTYFNLKFSPTFSVDCRRFFFVRVHSSFDLKQQSIK